MAPLKSDPTESFSAMAYAIVSQHEAVRLLERDFDRELAESARWRVGVDWGHGDRSCLVVVADGRIVGEASTYDAAMDLARGIHDEEPTKAER